MTLAPLTRRRMLSSLDEDAGDKWTPSEREAFIDTAKRTDAQRDRANIEAGRHLLADYQGDDGSYREACRKFASELFESRP